MAIKGNTIKIHNSEKENKVKKRQPKKMNVF